MQVRVFVTPRKGILDPQGRAVEQSLKNLGFAGVGAVRVGKYITLEVEAPSAEVARGAIDAMCEQLLANPLIEDYRFEIEQAPASVPEDPPRKAHRSGPERG